MRIDSFAYQNKSFEQREEGWVDSLLLPFHTFFILFPTLHILHLLKNRFQELEHSEKEIHFIHTFFALPQQPGYIMFEIYLSYTCLKTLFKTAK